MPSPGAAAVLQLPDDQRPGQLFLEFINSVRRKRSLGKVECLEVFVINGA
jgi:hypothetical protein